MLDTLLPRGIDAAYHGHKLAPWLLIVIVSVKIAQVLAVFFGGQFVVGPAEGIALDSYTPAAAQAIVFAFVGWKVDRLLIAMLCLLVLDRYRSLIPLMFTVFVLEDLGRRLTAHFYPFVTVGTPVAPMVNLVLLALAIVGLPLSLWKRNES